jgi:phytanoyl-CoA hydroxylase
MAYPIATEADRAIFEEHGWIVVTDAIDPADLVELEAHCQEILDKKETMAFDWAWEEGKSPAERDFKIVQSSPTMFWPALNESRFRHWAIEFASVLMDEPVEFWYDQFLAKPPQKGATTYWHQDEGYWGRNLDDRGLTCWMPFHDVDEANGCMHFIDGGHRDGVLEHRQPEGIKSDLLFCEPDESRMVSCPITLGSVTFHHGKTPHMTTPNVTDSWRRILTQHLRVAGTEGEGDHYPWKIYVNQATGDMIKPSVR